MVYYSFVSLEPMLFLLVALLAPSGEVSGLVSFVFGSREPQQLDEPAQGLLHNEPPPNPPTETKELEGAQVVPRIAVASCVQETRSCPPAQKTSACHS